jgi:tetratricopeptide (TPR) repeat protein
MRYALLFVVLIAPVLWAQQRATDEEVLQRAIVLHQSGNLDSAIRAYREYLAVQPDSIEARSNLGAVLARAGRYEEAIAEYDRALSKDAQNAAILLNLGLAYYKIGRAADAAARFEQAAALAPQFKDQAILLLASCYNSLGKYKKAIAALFPLEDEKSADQAFNYLYGTALIGDGESARGAVVINRILSRGDSAEARLLLGTTKLQALDHEGALADLEKAIALNGRLPGAHARLGELLLAMGEIARAAAAFRQELALDPTDFVSNLNIGVLAKQDQEYSDARLYLERALRSRPGDPGVRYQLALLDLATGGLDQARKALETLMGESPGFAEVHGTLATVYYRLDRTADGDRERALAQKLTDERQAAQRGVLPRERQTRESQPR